MRTPCGYLFHVEHPHAVHRFRPSLSPVLSTQNKKAVAMTAFFGDGLSAQRTLQLCSTRNQLFGRAAAD